MFNISVIGAGNGGQAMAGHLSLMGHDVTLYTRSNEKKTTILQAGGIILKEAINGFGKLTRVTNSIEEAVSVSEILMITVTANAHGEIAERIFPFLKEGQIIVLNPGRTGGALEIRNIFNKKSLRIKVYVAECQSLVYACRAEQTGQVRVIGVKDRVFFATLPSSDIEIVYPKLKTIYSCLKPVENVLITSLENIGAIFHPAIVLFNAAAIERGNSFYFYNDITPQISSFISKIDKERLSLGKAFGIDLHSAEEWVSFAYKNVKGNNLYSKMKNNPAYFKILAPTLIRSRLLMEDIPTGILPMIELGKMAGLELPIMSAIYMIVETLLDEDFRGSGRTLDRLGLDNTSPQDIFRIL